MGKKRFGLAAALSVLAAGVLVRAVWPHAAPAAPLLYRCIPLPMEYAADLNNKGDVVGTNDNLQQLLLWKKGRLRVLAKSPFFLTKAERVGDGEPPYIHPSAITEDGRTTGIVEYVFSGAITTGMDYPFVWEKGRLRCGSLPVGRTFDKKGRKVGSEDIGVETLDHGGSFQTEYSEHRYRNRHAVLYEAHGAKFKDLGVLSGKEWSNAFAINEKGQVVGTSERRAFLRQNGVMRDLGRFPNTSDDTFSSDARDINERSQVVGEATVFRQSETTRKPFLWQNGTMVDLNTVSKLPPGVILMEAVAINDRGQILANGGNEKTNREQAFLLTPIK